MTNSNLFAICLAVSVSSGCSWFGVSEAQKELEQGASAPIEIPETLDDPAYVDLMPIPDIDDYRGLSDREFEVGLPDALATNFGVEQIIIRRLGDKRWVFLDQPTATIWPQVLLYFEENALPLTTQDAGSGTLETEWLVGSGAETELELETDAAIEGESEAESESEAGAEGDSGDESDADAESESGDEAESEAESESEGEAESESRADKIFNSLEAAAGWQGDFTGSQYRFRVSVEPGVRAGSTELYVTEKEAPIGSPLRPDALDWDAGSDHPELEGKLLSALAYYLGDRITAEPAVSLLATGLQESKATLVTGDTGLTLKYKLDFDRAWATVGAALEDALIRVEDLDRSSGDYYVIYTGQYSAKPGLIRRMFTFGGAGDDSDNLFKIHLEAAGEEVQVTVASESNEPSGQDPTATLLLSERLLKLIREHST